MYLIAALTMRISCLFLAILIACLPASLFGSSPLRALERGDQVAFVPASPDGGGPDASVRPLRKAVLDNENDQDNEDSGRPHYLSGEELAAGLLCSAGLTSGLWIDLPAGHALSSAPLYLVLRTLLI